MKKIITLTESDLTRIVKRVIMEQQSKSEMDTLAKTKMSKVTPKQGGKYCFTQDGLSKEIGNTGQKNIVLHKIVTGETLGGIKTKQTAALHTMNPLCKFKDKNGFRAGDVMMYSTLSSM